jgi:proteasome accessory factor B
VIRPYAFVLSGRDWMVLAEDQAAGQVKLFYLARIEGAKPTKERYTIPRDFDAEKFFRNTFGLFVGDATPFQMRVRFSPAVSDGIRELQFHPDQKIETTPSGEAILEIPAQSIKEARRFVLAWGKDAVVLDPPELIADLRAEAGAMKRGYEELRAKTPGRNPGTKAKRKDKRP